jgi:F0F1-type ATP synthase delta subunit
MALRKDMSLPISVVSLSDVRRLLRELEDIESQVESMKIRKSAKKTPLVVSHTLEAIVFANDLNLESEAGRLNIKQFLNELERKSSIVHVSFATEPTAEIVEKITTWFRANAGPYTLVQSGVQPEITAGCVVRTRNRLFDFSLRKGLNEKKQVLSDLLEAKD